MYNINKSDKVFKNEIVESFNEIDKMVIYEALRNNINVMYTTNNRTIPYYDNLYISIDSKYKIIINPVGSQIDWIDSEIFNINVLDKILTDKNISKLIDAKMNKVKMYDRMINNLSLNTNYQYSVDTIKEYVEYRIRLLELV